MSIVILLIMSIVVSRLRSKPEWKLERMAKVLCKEAEEWFGLEKPASGKGSGEGKKRGGPSRRERKIAEVKRYKKRLESNLGKAEERKEARYEGLVEACKEEG